MINKPKEKKQECETYKHEDVVKRAANLRLRKSESTQQEAIHNSQQKSDKVKKKDDEVSTENVYEEISIEMEAKIPETKDSVPDDVAKQIWAPYNNSRHYETVQKEKSDNKTGLSTMTQLMDPWDFVSDYVNNLLKKKEKEGVSARIDPFKYEDPQQLLLKIMNVSVKFMSDDPIFDELFDRCNRQYDFLKQLEEESMEERFEELEEQFEEKSTKHQDVKFFVTSEKDNDTKQSSLKKFLAERDDNWKTPEQKVAAEEASLKMTSLEEDLSAKQTEVENERASEQTCMQILGDLYQAIGEKVSNGGFTQSGGHQAYKDEVWFFVFSPKAKL